MIELNNASQKLNKMKEESVKDKIPFITINNDQSLDSPNITDSSIKNNSQRLVNLFDPVVIDSEPKRLVKKK